MNRLGADILSYVCRFFFCKDITLVRRVCRAWRFLRVPMKQVYIQDERNINVILSISKRVQKIECEFDLNQRLLEFIQGLTNFPDLISLAFQGSRRSRPMPLIFDAKPNTSLIDLTLYNCSQVCDSVLEQLLCIFCNLTKLEIRICPRITDQGVLKIAKTNILELKLSCEVITDRGLAYLQSMSLLNLAVIGHRPKMHVITTSWLGCGFRDLMSLSLSHVSIGNELLTCSNISSLSFSQCAFRLSRTSFEECFPLLERLEFDAFSKLDSFYYQNCVGIKHLMLIDESQKEDILKVASSLINLETLDFIDFTFSETCMKHLTFDKLKRLSFSHRCCGFWFHSFIRHVPTGCPAIEDLDLSCMPRMFEGQVLLVLEMFPMLRVLTISDRHVSLKGKRSIGKRHVQLKFS